MKWQVVVVASLVCGLVTAQTPPAPGGGVKPVPKSSGKPTKGERSRVLERAKNMRTGITTGQQLKSHVKVRVRLQNGNRLTGVVKDGRLVERVDGLRFVDAQARDTGAGIRLWYSGNTRSYIFIPFGSLRSYEVVQRLSPQQLVAIEKEMQMAEKRAAEKKAKAERDAQRKASSLGQPPGAAPATLPEQNLPESAASKLEKLKSMGAPGQVPAAGPAAGPTAGPAVGASQTPEGQKAGGAKPVAEGKKTGDEDVGGELKEVKRELAWANLLRSYPPKDGWNEAKKNEIARRQVVIGVPPSKFELEFVEKFDEWIKACEHNGIDPNASVVKKPPTKREQRRAERARIRGR